MKLRVKVSCDRARVLFPRMLRTAKLWSAFTSPRQDRASKRISLNNAPPFWIRVWYGEDGFLRFISRNMDAGMGFLNPRRKSLRGFMALRPENCAPRCVRPKTCKKQPVFRRYCR
jgi:hypothetical protein